MVLRGTSNEQNSSDNINRVDSLLNQLRAANGRQIQESSPQLTWQQRLNARKQELANKETKKQEQVYQSEQAQNAKEREAKGIEKFLTTLNRRTSDFVDSFGFNANKDAYGALDPRTLTSFAASLPFQSIQGLTEGAANIYEAISGKNILENRVDEDTGATMIADYELDPMQKLASVGNAAINIGGQFTGGSANMIAAPLNVGKNAIKAYGAGSKVAKAAGTAANAANKADKEIKFLSGSRFTNSPAKAFAIDVADEAGEEFFQSFLEDTRYDSWDDESLSRALEGAAWGAFGGALMTGGGTLVNTAAKQIGKQVNNSSDEVQVTSPRKANDLAGTVDDSQFVHYTNAVKEAMNEDAHSGNKEVGSSSGKLTKHNRYVSEGDNFISGNLGFELLVDIWNQNDDSKKELERKLGLDQIEGGSELAESWFGYDPEKAPEQIVLEINQQLENVKNSGKYFTFAYGRNPGTNKTGIGLLVLNKVTLGSTINVDPHMDELLGSDNDGDDGFIGIMGQMMAYAEENGFPINHLMSRSSSLRTPDMVYTRFSHDFSNTGLVFNAFSNYASRLGLPISKINELKDNFEKVLSIEDNSTRYQEIAKFFYELQQELYAEARKRRDSDVKKSKNKKEAAKAADRRLKQEINNIDINTGFLFSDLQERDYWEQALDTAMQNADVEQVIDEVYQEYREEKLKPLGDIELKHNETNVKPQMASLGKREFLAQVAAFLDMMTGIEEGVEKLSFFRQDQIGPFSVKGHEVMFNGVSLDPNDVGFQRILAVMMGLSAVGTVPETTVITALKTAVIAQTMSDFIEWNGSPYVKDKTQWNKLKEFFVKNHDEAADKYKEASKLTTFTEGELKDFGIKTINKIGDNESAFNEKFIDFFGDYRLNEIFVTNDKDPINNFFLSDALNYILLEGSDYGYLSSVEGGREILRDLAKESFTHKERINNSVEAEVKKILDRYIIPTLSNHINPNPKTGEYEFDPEYLLMANAVLSSLTRLVGGKAALEFKNMVSADTCLKSQWGIDIFMSNDIDVILNALAGWCTRYQYADELDLWDSVASDNTLTDTQKEDRLNKISENLYAKSKISPFHNFIYESFVSTGSLETLIYVTNSSNKKIRIDGYDTSKVISWRDKIELLSGPDFLGSKMLLVSDDKPYPLIVDMLTTDDGALALSSISQKLDRSKQDIKQADYYNIDAYRADKADLDRIIDDAGKDKSRTEEKVLDIIKFNVVHNLSLINEDIIATYLAEQFGISKQNADKGTVTGGQYALHQMVNNISNSSQTNFTSAITEDAANFPTLSNFASNIRFITNVIFGLEEYTVYDDIGNRGIITINQVKLFDAYGITIKEGEDLNYQQLSRLIDYEPILMSILVPGDTSAVQVGGDLSTSNKASSRLSDFVKQELNKSRDESAYWEEREKLKVSNALVQNPDFYLLAGYYIEDTQTVNISNIGSRCKEAYKKAFDFCYKLTCLSPEKYKIAIDAVSNKNISVVAKRIYDTYQNAKLLALRQSSGDIVSKTVAEQLVDDFQASYTISQISNKWKKLFPQDSGVSSFDPFKQRVNNKTGQIFDLWINGIDSTVEDFKTLNAIVMASNIDGVDSNYRIPTEVSLIETAKLNAREYIEGLPDEKFSRQEKDDLLRKSDQLFEEQRQESINIFKFDPVLFNSFFVISQIDQFFDANKTPDENADAFISKAKEIFSKYGEGEEIYGLNGWTIDEDGVRKAFREGKTKGLDKVKEYAYHCNYKVFERVVDNLRMGKQLDVTPQAMKNAVTGSESIVMLADLGRKARRDSSPNGKYGFDESLEVESLLDTLPDFTSGSNSYIANRAKMNSGSARAAFTVSNNAQALRLVSAIGLLGTKSSCSAPPIKVNIQEVIDGLGDDYNHCRYYVHNPKNIRVLSSLSKEELEQMRDSGLTEINVYHRFGCTCGNCVHHDISDGSFKDMGVSTFADLVATLIGESQEDMAMRLKKTMEAAKSVVDSLFKLNPKYNEFQLLNGIVSSAGGDIVKGITDTVQEFRESLSRNYFANIQEAGLSDISLYDCDKLAQFTGSTFVIAYNDGSHEVFHLENLYSEKTSADIINKLTNQDNPAVGIRMLPMSLEILSHKILAKTLPAINKAKANGKPLSEEEINTIARNALFDWSETGFNTDKFTIKDVMSEIQGRGIGSSVMIKSINSRTRAQRFFGQTLESVQEPLKSDVRFQSANKDYKRDMAVNSRSIGLSTKDGVFTAAFVSGIDPYTEDKFLQNIKSIADQTNGEKDSIGGDKEFVLCHDLDGSVSGDAFDYAQKHFHLLFISNESKNIPFDILKWDTGRRETLKTIVNGQTKLTTYKVINPNGSNAYKNAVESSVKSRRWRMPIDAIETTVNDIERDLIMADSLTIRNSNEPVTVKSEGEETISIRELFPSIEYGEIFDISRNDIDKIMPDSSLDGFNVDFGYYLSGVNESVKDSKKKQLEAAVKKYLSEVKTSNDNYFDMQKRNNVKSGQCVGMYKINYGGTFYYAPIIVGITNMPAVANNLYIKRLSNNSIRLEVNEWLNLKPGDTVKIYVMGAPEKSQMAFADPRITMPKMRVGGKSDLRQVTAVDDGLSFRPRIDAGLSKQDLKMNLHYMSRKYGASLFYTLNEDGTHSPNQEIKDQFSTEDEWNLFVSGDEKTWDKFLSETPTRYFSKDGELNKLFVLAARAARQAHIPFADVFTSIERNPDGTFTPTEMDFSQELVYQGFNPHKLFRIYHAMNSNLCPDGLLDPSDDYVFDHRGRALIEGKRKYVQIRPKQYSTTTAERTPGDMASLGLQQIQMALLQTGILPEKLDKLARYFAAQIGYVNPEIKNDEYIENIMKKSIDDDLRVENKRYRDTRNIKFSFSSKNQVDYKRDVIDTLNKTMANPVQILGKDADPLNKETIEQVDQLVYDFESKTGLDLGKEDVMAIYMQFIGWSSTLSGTNGLASSLDQFEKALSIMAESFTKDGLLITGGKIQNIEGVGEDRYKMPLIVRRINEKIYNQSDLVKSKYATFEDYQNAQLIELKTTLKEIEKNCPEKSKKKSLFRLSDALCVSNGFEVELGAENISRVSTENELKQRQLLALFNLADSPQDIIELYETVKEATKDIIENKKARSKTTASTTKEVVGGRIDTKTVWHKDDAEHKILDALTKTTKFMAVAFNPFITVSNVAGARLSGGILNFSLKHINGVYKPGIELRPETIELVKKDPTFKKVYAAYRAAEYAGLTEEFITTVHNEEELDDFIKRNKPNSKLAQAFKRIYELSVSGGDWNNELQMGLFVQRFAQLVGLDDSAYSVAGIDLGSAIDEDTRKYNKAYWGEVLDPKTGQTRLEAMLIDNPSLFFFKVLGKNDLTSYNIAQQSLQFAKQGEMAQRNLVTEIWGEICRRYNGIPDFLMTTTCCRFLNYTTNMTARVLQFCAPMSSINYLAIKYMEGTDFGKSLNVTELQTKSGLREALLCDIMHLGFGATACILVGLSGVLQPPEDEDKWINAEEWTIFGLRVAEKWWIQDILGPALPMAVAMSAAMKGRGDLFPRIIVNGVAKCCWNNPLFAIPDMVSFIFDPLDNMTSDYAADAIKYENAKGGAATFLPWLSNNAVSFTFNWVAQFFTPAILKEIYNGLQQYEVSYKKIFQEDAYGNLVIDPDTGQMATDNETQFFSQVRKVTRKNPVLGLILDLTIHPKTGFMAHEMPRTIYQDQYQMFSSSTYSLFNENGTEKTDVEKQVIAAEVISTLLASDNMEELYQSGFYIPYKTKLYCSNIIKAQIKSLEDTYSTMKANGDLDYYILGEGDFLTGEKRAGEIYKEYTDQKRNLQNLYYDKLWSEPMRRSKTVYNRFNTSYTQDANGEWYATGFMDNLSLLPFKTAQGDLTNPGGTAGKEGDWSTLSILNGEPLGERALVAVDTSNVQTPDLDEFDGDFKNMSLGNGDNSSGDNGSLGNNSAATMSTSGYPGYYRSGGGSGGSGGSSPNIYSRVSKLNPSSPRTMNPSRTYSSNFDYLRPDWETKGSRDSNKRSDI